jgi:hypothetical protein
VRIDEPRRIAEYRKHNILARPTWITNRRQTGKMMKVSSVGIGWLVVGLWLAAGLLSCSDAVTVEKPDPCEDNQNPLIGDAEGDTEGPPILVGDRWWVAGDYDVLPPEYVPEAQGQYVRVKIRKVGNLSVDSVVLWFRIYDEDCGLHNGAIYWSIDDRAFAEAPNGAIALPAGDARCEGWPFADYLDYLTGQEVLPEGDLSDAAAALPVGYGYVVPENEIRALNQGPHTIAIGIRDACGGTSNTLTANIFVEYVYF